MTRIVEEKREAISAACRRHRVARLDVFGSSLRDDFVEGESDIDLLVAFEDMEPSDLADEYYDLVDELSTIMGMRVDLVMDGALKNKYVRAEVLKTREPLYAA